MTINIFETIKKTAGWCAHADKTMKIITDYQFSTVLYAGSAAFFIFLIASLVFPIPVYFAVLSVLLIFLTSVILLIQDRTIMVFTSSALIIRRPLFKPVEILKDDILKIEVVKNPNRRFRRVIIPLVIIALIFWAKGAMDTLSRSTAYDRVPFSIHMIFLEVILFIFVTVLVYKWYIRSHHENFLKIISRTKREVTIYVDNPQELVSKLGGYQ